MMSTAVKTQIALSFVGTEITSNPKDAEIFLDDKFVDTCPATLRIPEGAHTLILKSAHHSDWNRSISILKDGTVKATLAPI